MKKQQTLPNSDDSTWKEGNKTNLYANLETKKVSLKNKNVTNGRIGVGEKYLIVKSSI